MNLNRKAWLAVATVIVAAVAVSLTFTFRHPTADLRQKPQQLLKLTVGMSWAPGNATMFIAKQLGYFSDAGIDLSLQPYPSGKLALAALLEGKVDLAIMAETPIALAALNGARFSVLATLHESGSNNWMIARRDRGIEKPSDLAGKKLGTVFGTSSEFIQDTILTLHKIDPHSIIRVNLTPAQTVDALIAGEVDAVTTWAPYTFELRERMKSAVAIFSDESIYTTTFNLVTREALLKQHPQALRGLLAAALKATAYFRADPDAGVRAAAQASNFDATVIKSNTNPANFTVSLNQSLVVAMEDQARWAIQRRLVEATAVPTFLEWIHTDTLAAIRPNAVSVIK